MHAKSCEALEPIGAYHSRHWDIRNHTATGHHIAHTKGVYGKFRRKDLGSFHSLSVY